MESWQGFYCQNYLHIGQVLLLTAQTHSLTGHLLVFVSQHHQEKLLNSQAPIKDLTLTILILVYNDIHYINIYTTYTEWLPAAAIAASYIYTKKYSLLVA